MLASFTSAEALPGRTVSGVAENQLSSIGFSAQHIWLLEEDVIGCVRALGKISNSH